jgi:hypothetical protein
MQRYPYHSTAVLGSREYLAGLPASPHLSLTHRFGEGQTITQLRFMPNPFFAETANWLQNTLITILLIPHLNVIVLTECHIGYPWQRINLLMRVPERFHDMSENEFDRMLFLFNRSRQPTYFLDLPGDGELLEVYNNEDFDYYLGRPLDLVRPGMTTGWTPAFPTNPRLALPAPVEDALPPVINPLPQQQNALLPAAIPPSAATLAPKMLKEKKLKKKVPKKTVLKKTAPKKKAPKKPLARIANEPTRRSARLKDLEAENGPVDYRE